MVFANNAVYVIASGPSGRVAIFSKRWQLHRGMSWLNVLDDGANSIPYQALPLLAALSASSAYHQYASGTSALPPRQHLDLEWNAAYYATAKNSPCGLRQFGRLMLHNASRQNVSAIIRQSHVSVQLRLI
ncbi:MAG TPA: hypothetical protein VKO67_12530 [Smithellaceae bacterium]|nr:hypothetical protein [Smithellaceae bacterium]